MSPEIEKYNEKTNRFDLQTLLDTSRLLIESHDFDFILNNLLLISMGKLMVNRAAVLWYDSRKTTYSAIKKKGRFTLPDPLQVRRSIFKSRTTIFCSDHEELHHLSDHGITLLIAIQNSEQHLGLLALGPRVNDQPISPEEIKILESFVFMSGIAISNSELVSELRETNRKLDYKVQELFTLFDLSKAFNATVDREQIKRLFKFALLGQLFIRRFFLIITRNSRPVVVTQNGIGSDLNDSQMSALFSLKKNIVKVDDDLLKQLPFLADMQISLLLMFNNNGGDPAIMGLGNRINGMDFEQTDFNFLISLGSLFLMSIQKTYFLEDQIEKQRLEEELHIARTIQQKLFPDRAPEIPGLQIAAKNVPSYQVGGDYYDLIRDNDGNLTMAIADVTGKGVPASLLMANLQSVLHILHPFDIGMVEATGQINSLIYQNTPSDKLISSSWGRFDHKKRTLRFVNAGHNPPLLIRKGSEPVQLSEGGVLLGAMPTITPYSDMEISLQKEDLLILYTDGVTEAMNHLEEEYGEERLINCVKALRDDHPEAILENIVADIKNYSGEHIGDDLTLIVCKVT